MDIHLIDFLNACYSFLVNNSSMHVSFLQMFWSHNVKSQKLILWWNDRRVQDLVILNDAFTGKPIAKTWSRCKVPDTPRSVRKIQLARKHTWNVYIPTALALGKRSEQTCRQQTDRKTCGEVETTLDIWFLSAASFCHLVLIYRALQGWAQSLCLTDLGSV